MTSIYFTAGHAARTRLADPRTRGQSKRFLRLARSAATLCRGGTGSVLLSDCCARPLGRRRHGGDGIGGPRRDATDSALRISAGGYGKPFHSGPTTGLSERRWCPLTV